MAYGFTEIFIKDSLFNAINKYFFKKKLKPPPHSGEAAWIVCP